MRDDDPLHIIAHNPLPKLSQTLLVVIQSGTQITNAFMSPTIFHAELG
jgi:hypothetical protein